MFVLIACELKFFSSEKMNTTTIVTSAHIPGVLTEEEEHEIKIFQDANKEFLNIPRRLDFKTLIHFKPFLFLLILS